MNDEPASSSHKVGSIFQLAILVVALFLAHTVLGQGHTPMRPASSAIATGVWRGDGIELVADGDGAAVEFSCASGKIAIPMIADKNGDFDLQGTWFAQHAGPIRRDEEGPAANKASYAGHMEGESMTLKVTLEKNDQAIGTFHLKLNGTTRLKKCR